MKNTIKSLGVFALTVFSFSTAVNAQQVENFQWKSTNQVKEKYGQPNRIVGPIGTFANYQLWEYENVTFAIANNRVFHQFNKDALKKMQLNETR